MEKKKRFNIIYNDNKEIGFGEGYYIIYENYEGEPTYDSMYRIYNYNEQTDMVTVGLINKIYHLYDLGYELDIYYKPNLKELF